MADEKSKKVAEEKEAMEQTADLAAKGTSAGRKGAKRKKTVVTLDTPMQTVLDSIEKGDELVFDHSSFLALPDNVVADMSKAQKDAYFTTKKMVEAKEGTNQLSHHEKRKRDWHERKISMIGGNAMDRLKHVAQKDAEIKKGYVARWLTPYDYRNWGETEGYQPVKAKESRKSIVIGPEDAPELMLCQVPEERIKEHRKARSLVSRERGSKAKQRERLEQKTDEINRAAGAGKDKEIKVVDLAERE